MTARRITSPLRHVEADSHAQVEAARAKVEDLRKAVAARQAGAASLHVAEYELHAALRRADADAGDDDPPEAA